MIQIKSPCRVIGGSFGTLTKSPVLASPSDNPARKGVSTSEQRDLEAFLTRSNHGWEVHRSLMDGALSLSPNNGSAEGHIPITNSLSRTADTGHRNYPRPD